MVLYSSASSRCPSWRGFDPWERPRHALVGSSSATSTHRPGRPPMPHGAASPLSTFRHDHVPGVRRVGRRRLAADAITSEMGWKVAVLGFVLTSLTAVALLTAARLAQSAAADGACSAARRPAQRGCSPPTSTGADLRVGIGYALVYPAAMIAKIPLAQILAGLS